MPEPDGPLSPDVAAFLLKLVEQQGISAALDDLEAVAALVAKAKRELREHLAAPAGRPDNGSHELHKDLTGVEPAG